VNEQTDFRTKLGRNQTREGCLQSRRDERAVPRRILVVKLADIGDMLTATPSLRALRESFPSSHISALVTPASAEVLEGLPWINNIIRFDKGLYDAPFRAFMPSKLAQAIRMGITLRRSQFDTVVVLHHLLTWWGVIKYALLALGSGAKIRLGLDDGRGWFYTHRAMDGGFGYLHEVDYWLSTVAVIGARTRDRRLRMFVSPEDDSVADRLIAGLHPPLVAIHPGSGNYSLARRWPVERFAQVADGLIDALGATIVIVGGPAEVDLAREMASMMRGRSANLAGKTSLKQLAAVLGRCDLFAGNDSGVMHVAVAVNTPVVAVFGPSNYRAWGPYFADSIPRNDGIFREKGALIRPVRACSPCLYPNPYRSGSRPCAEVSCLHDIPADTVLAAGVQLLDPVRRAKSIDNLVV